MAQLQGFHHVKLPVAEVSRSREWYQRVLDLRVHAEFVEGGTLMGVAMADQADSLNVALRHDPVRAAALAGFDPLALRVPTRDGVHEWRARLDGLDIQHAGIVTGHKGGSVLVGLHDPDGFEIRLYAD